MKIVIRGLSEEEYSEMYALRQSLGFRRWKTLVYFLRYLHDIYIRCIALNEDYSFREVWEDAKAKALEDEAEGINKA